MFLHAEGRESNGDRRDRNRRIRTDPRQKPEGSRSEDEEASLSPATGQKGLYTQGERETAAIGHPIDGRQDRPDGNS